MSSKTQQLGQLTLTTELRVWKPSHKTCTTVRQTNYHNATVRTPNTQDFRAQNLRQSIVMKTSFRTSFRTRVSRMGLDSFVEIDCLL